MSISSTIGRDLPHWPSSVRTVLVFRQYPNGSFGSIAFSAGCAAVLCAGYSVLSTPTAPAIAPRRVIVVAITASIESPGPPFGVPIMMPLLTLAVHLLAADPAGYAKPDLLAEAETLVKPGA